jgi:hypothetical protein
VAASLATPPALAASAYLAALRKGDLAAFATTVTSGPLVTPARFQALRSDMPADSRVVGLVPQVDGSVLATVEGHEGDGPVVGHTLRLVREGDAWKVSLPAVAATKKQQ